MLTSVLCDAVQGMRGGEERSAREQGAVPYRVSCHMGVACLVGVACLTSRVGQGRAGAACKLLYHWERLMLGVGRALKKHAN